MSDLREAVLGPAPTPTPTAALDVDGLTVAFDTRHGPLTAVDGISYRIERGRTLGVVGESGCGKSVAALAVMGLIDPPGRVSAKSIRLHGSDIGGLAEPVLRALRGNDMAMIFQEPMTALNPVMTVGNQIAEVVSLHTDNGRREAWRRALDLLDQVGIPLPMRRAHEYPHQLSGGMRQRVMIAMALACEPTLLIADEPTTALDVTVQAQILELMLELQEKVGMAIQFISHDLGVISEIADDVMVMYAGNIVEFAPADEIFGTPRHPYTKGLLNTLPRIGARHDRLPAIRGTVPDLANLPSGCAFRDRCPNVTSTCAARKPKLEEATPGHRIACHAPDAP